MELKQLMTKYFIVYAPCEIYILPSVLILIFFLQGSWNFYCIPYYILSHCWSSSILTASVLHGPADVSIILLIVFCVLPQT